MKLITILILVPFIAVGQGKEQSFENIFRQLPKEELKKFYKVMEKEIESDCGNNTCIKLKESKATSADVNPHKCLRTCITLLNIKGIAEDDPVTGLAWPVEGNDLKNLNEEAPFAVMRMVALGFSIRNLRNSTS